MEKKKRILYSLIVVVLCICMTICAFACSNKDEDTTTDEDIDESELLFTNGNFNFVSDSTASYPQSPEDWTGTAGSTSSSTKTPDVEKAGVIDVSKMSNSDYDYNGNPSKVGDDNKILMIYNKTATAYYYKSSSATIDKNSYYVLKFYVKTSNISGSETDTEIGAYAYVTGDAYVAFTAIQTDPTKNAGWQEYDVYLKGSSESSSITLSLGLGDGNKTTGHMTSGYAFFDSVSLTKLEDIEGGKTAAEQYNEVTASNTVAKYDMNQPDHNFNYVSSTASLPYTPSQFTGAAGSGATSAPSGSSYLEKGILDISASKGSYSFNSITSTVTKVSDDITSVTDDLGDRMLYIYNKQDTAYSYTSNDSMVVEVGKYYKVTVYAKTYLTKGSAFVRIKNGSDTYIEVPVDTSGAWEAISMYLYGNQYEENSFDIELGLGQGGKESTTLACGLAFFDCLTYEEIDEATYTAADASLKKSFYTDETSATPIALNKLSSTLYEDAFLNSDGTAKYTTTEVSTAEIASTSVEALNITNSRATAFSMSTITKTAKDADTVDLTNKELIKIAPNKAYLISFYAKTENVVSSSNATIKFSVFDPDYASKYDSSKTTAITISVNSENLEDYILENNNGYTRFCAYILGDAINTKYLSLDIEFGTGTSSTVDSTLVAGKLSIANLKILDIDYDTFKAATTGTTVYSYTFSSSSSDGISSNGYFTNIDTASTNSLYTTGSAWDNDGKLVGTAVPSSWTITDDSVLTQKGGTSVAGAVSINDYADMSTYIASSVTEGLDPSYDTEKNPNILMIHANNVKSLGYKSTTISLSANSYYLVSVYARVTEGAFSINVAPSGATENNQGLTTYLASNVGTTWNQYLYLIKTGFVSQTITVTLYAGSPANTAATTATAFFTMATYSSINEDVYNAMAESDKDLITKRTTKNEWYTDTMDNYSSSTTSLFTPSNWTGAKVDSSSSSDDDDLAAGIFNQVNGNWDLLDIDADKDAIAKTIFGTDPVKDDVGDSVLVIYNKELTTYSYSSSSITLEAGKYYKVSINVLTKDIKYITEADVDKDDSDYDSYKNKNLIDSATLTLKVNNKSYSFGKATEKEVSSTATTEELEEYNLAKARIVDNTTWTTYTWYIALDDEITDSVSATLTMSVGGKNVSYWATGYLFMDNFLAQEMTEADFTAAAKDEDYAAKEDHTYSDVVKNNYKIKYTSEDASAEEEEEEEEEEDTEETKKNNLLWLYITSGTIGGIIVIVLIIYFIKKYAPKKKKTFKKSKASTSNDNSRDKFKD